ncbi:MAG: hypothetical protein MZU97_13960 [Bacillus subtilis]|nr:hypothetical protein [Bacillus subtilis]
MKRIFLVILLFVVVLFVYIGRRGAVYHVQFPPNRFCPAGSSSSQSRSCSVSSR